MSNSITNSPATSVLLPLNFNAQNETVRSDKLMITPIAVNNLQLNVAVSNLPQLPELAAPKSFSQPLNSQIEDNIKSIVLLEIDDEIDHLITQSVGAEVSYQGKVIKLDSPLLIALLLLIDLVTKKREAQTESWANFIGFMVQACTMQQQQHITAGEARARQMLTPQLMGLIVTAGFTAASMGMFFKKQATDLTKYNNQVLLNKLDKQKPATGLKAIFEERLKKKELSESILELGRRSEKYIQAGITLTSVTSSVAQFIYALTHSGLQSGLSAAENEETLSQTLRDIIKEQAQCNEKQIGSSDEITKTLSEISRALQRSQVEQMKTMLANLRVRA